MALTTLPPEVEALFAAGGAMGALMRQVDWAATPIGEPATWPQSLRTAIGVCLESRFPMLIWWGPDLVKIYNDAYSVILADKHPRAMGQRGEDCWPEIWDTIGPMLSSVLAGEGATYSEDQLLPLVRHGFPEECYFTFSYSPIRVESGGIGGVFTAVTETTGRVIGARRLATLRALAERMLEATSPEQVLTQAAAVLGTAPADLPCAVMHRLTADGWRPAAVAGALTDAELSELGVAVAAALAAPAPAGSLVELPRPLGEHAVRRVVVLPVEAGGVAARLVAGLSPALRVDGDYRSFLSLVAGQVSTALSEALHYQAERARAEALAALDEAKTAFFANVSHEFRTPLTLMLGPTEDALADRAEPLTTRQRERTELVRRNALRLLRLVNALLDFSRLESGRVSARYEPVDLSAYTRELASAFRSAVERAGLTYVVDCPPLPEPVLVDREMWEKIVLNLLSNALKFTFDGSITVRLHAQGDEAVLTVTDTGVGIDPADQPALFQRFHRVKGVRSRTFEGSGIGLALVADLARLHGGTASVTSAPGRGSTFTVTVRRGLAHLPPDQVAGSAEASAPGPGSAEQFVTEALRWLEPGDAALLAAPAQPPAPQPPEEQRPRVLVVDDNADMRDYVAAVLSGSYRVEGAADGVAALERIRREPPDLVLTDVMMPRLDGFGLLTALRADPQTARLPVIMLSARAGEDAAVEGLDAGADDYLAKPFAARELQARVRAAVTLESMRREAAVREHRIADALQRSLLPGDTFAPEQLEVASYYRPGTEGTQVGGDWYDVIELGAGRAGLVIGDVMGRGVRAAAVMGQLRAAVRAYARLDLRPADVLELLDGVVRDLGEDQIVTCVYAVYDPAGHVLTYANAGHVPPMVATGGDVRVLTGSAAPPLGTDVVVPTEESVTLPPGTTLALYTDGLVERRGRDIDVGLRELSSELAVAAAGPVRALPARLAETLGLHDQDDDVALLVVRVQPGEPQADVMRCEVASSPDAVPAARAFARQALRRWAIPAELMDDAVLLVSELVTNAVVHARPPVSLRLQRSSTTLVVEVSDGAAFLPRRLRAGPEDEHGRGLHLVARLADRWGARPTADGKATWCSFRTDRQTRPDGGAPSPPSTG